MKSNQINATEAQALTGDKASVIKIVSALRKYRKASEIILNRKAFGDEIELGDLNEFEKLCENAEWDLFPVKINELT